MRLHVDLALVDGDLQRRRGRRRLRRYRHWCSRRPGPDERENRYRGACEGSHVGILPPCVPRGGGHPAATRAVLLGRGDVVQSPTFGACPDRRRDRLGGRTARSRRTRWSIRGYAARAYTPGRVAVLPPDVFVVVDQVGDNDPAQAAALGQQVSGEMVPPRRRRCCARVATTSICPRAGTGSPGPDGNGAGQRARISAASRTACSRSRTAPTAANEGALARRAWSRPSSRRASAAATQSDARPVRERQGRGRHAGQANGEHPRRRVLRRDRCGGHPRDRGVIEGRRQRRRFGLPRFGRRRAARDARRARAVGGGWHGAPATPMATPRGAPIGTPRGAPHPGGGGVARWRRAGAPGGRTDLLRRWPAPGIGVGVVVPLRRARVHARRERRLRRSVVRRRSSSTCR